MYFYRIFGSIVYINQLEMVNTNIRNISNFSKINKITNNKKQLLSNILIAKACAAEFEILKKPEKANTIQLSKPLEVEKTENNNKQTLLIIFGTVRAMAADIDDIIEKTTEKFNPGTKPVIKASNFKQTEKNKQ